MNDAQATLDFWQKKLRLCNWRITIEVEGDKHHSSRWGCVHVSSYDHTAKIRVVDVGGRRAVDFHRPVPTIEASIVHELIEVVLSDVIDESGGDDKIPSLKKEQAVNRMVTALLACTGRPEFVTDQEIES